MASACRRCTTLLLLAYLGGLGTRQPQSAIGSEPAAGVAASPSTAAEAAEKQDARNGASDDRHSTGVEDLYSQVRPGLAVITVAGRDGRRHGLGTGFVIAADGLIATNLHVIGEGRAIAVEMADGKRYEVTTVHASDRFLDLAVIRVDARGLTPIALGDSDALREGQAVVALGNPQGLQHSVVSGVVSGRREIDGRSMIQLAIPLEQGNSGGPLVDLQGRACGILTLKHARTANLGFAVAVNDLKALLARPNPVPISRWVKQGALDPQAWVPLFGANWRARGGQIFVEGEGDGFGGRSLCLANQDPPELPFEVAVNVRLEDEAGAAGLAFAADGGDKHYGFYPSSGAMRLTRFDGPDVLQWTILAERATPFYHRGDWNKLHVRIEPKQIICSVNGHAVITLDVTAAPAGKVGLTKFRDTNAAFKNFQVASQIAGAEPADEIVARIDKLLGDLSSDEGLGMAAVDRLAADASISAAALDQRAERLTQQSEQLRRLGDALRQARAQAELVKILGQPEESIDLVAAALWVARLDNDDIDIGLYRRQIDRMAAEIAAGLAADADESARMAALNKFFFEESGFHGSRGEYYHRANSYLNDVLDDREGLPITLSIVYMELARRLNLRVEGVGLPGHFVVRFRPRAGDSRLIDVFDGGESISPEDAVRRVFAATGAPPSDEQQQATTKRAIIVRMLYNLMGTSQRQADRRATLRYLDALLAISPDAHQERWARAMLRWQSGEQEGAKQDADWLLAHDPDDVDLARVRDFRAVLERAAK